MICPSCGRDNRAEARFCDACGTRLGAAEPRAPTEERAERRQLSVVFCDLVGSTALSGTVDPEELREIIGRYQQAASAAVTALGGHTAIYLGDGILTYFGYPDAHEDDVERAVRAGLDIVRAVGRLRREREGPSLQVRVAVHTGDVVVGDLEVAGAGIFGATPNVAARLQDVAPPDGVVVSETTYRLSQGLFRVSDLGFHTLEGLDQPMKAYLVLGPSGIRSRFSRTGHDRAPLVGRERESELLWQAWEEARSQAGRAVLVRGEAGIGKSRLVSAFHQRISDTVHTWLECAGTPYTRHSAFAAVIELQREALRFTADQSDVQKLAVLEAAVARAEMPVDEAVPILARLHSLSIPASSPHAHALEGLSPEAIRRRTKHVAGDWLLRLGRQQAVALLVEDLHWLDPSSVELLGEILRSLDETRVLLILTARPEFREPWPPELMDTLDLTGLARSAAAQLVHAMDGADALSPSEVEAIVTKTDGVPLFVEEMTRAALERGGTTGDGGVPDTLKGLLMARIDRLGAAREVAQVGAILGREFERSLLEAVWDKGGAALDAGLARVVDEDLATRTDGGDQVLYTFRHALIQEAAYESLLKTTRRTYHARIGEALVERFPGAVETRPELVAHHFQQARSWEKAVPLWAAAGQRAARRSENVEAGRHLHQGLACVDQLPDGPERLQQELLFRTHLGANLVAVKGYGAPEVAENIARAQELCGLIGPSPLLFPVLYNVWVFHLVRAEPATSRLARDLLDLAAETDPDRFLTWAHIACAISAYWSGEFADARRHAAESRAHYRWDPETITLFGDDTEAYGFLYQGLPRWFEGYPDQASSLLDQALTSAEKRGYAFPIAGIRAFRAQFGHLSGRPDWAATEGARTVQVSGAQGYPLFLATGLMHTNWAAMRGGDLETAFQGMQDGLALYRSTGALLNLPYLQALVAEGHMVRREWSQALEMVDRGLEDVRQRFDRIYQPELHRMRAELLVRQGSGGDAVVQELAAALETARAMGSRILELRAAVTAHELDPGNGSRDRLAALLDAFTEGLEEPDLQAARRVLAD